MLHILAQVGWPVLDRFRLGDSFAISPHGIFIAFGFMTGAWLLGRIAPRWGVSHDDAQGVVFWSLIGAIVGARVFYVIGHFSEFDSFVDMLKIWEGGISLLGGIAGAVIVNAPRVRRQGYRFFQVADPVAPSLALGIVIGRIGDLIIADHLGKPTSWLLAWTYRGGTIAPPFSCQDEFCQASLQGGHLETINREGARLLDEAGRVIAQGVGVHQTALYDMVSAAALFVLLFYVMMSKPRREGVLTLTFGLWYGVSRVIEDSLRIDKEFFGLTGSQWTAATVATICAALLVWFAMRPDPDAPSGGGPARPSDPSSAESEPATVRSGPGRAAEPTS
ncbi:MAG: prolipoprotein diacylglyceryl transferase [Actinomycetota bacterium]|nr:prolipoprotein diacylglyceryl transferase [Actinomycetota bacterium]